MKNLNQATRKTAKKPSPAPAQKRRSHEPKPSTLERESTVDIFSLDPFGQESCFRMPLDFIFNTMEPEVYHGDWVQVTKRKDMKPKDGDIVLGLMNTGRHAFGVYCEEEPGYFKLAFINPKYPPVIRSEENEQVMLHTPHLWAADNLFTFSARDVLLQRRRSTPWQVRSAYFPAANWTSYRFRERLNLPRKSLKLRINPAATGSFRLFRK